MPADANPSGDIFGGWLMSQMDLAAANAASRLRGALCDGCVMGWSFINRLYWG